jgi:hypothetical protein
MAFERKRPRSRWEQDNQLSLNPWAFLAVALLVGAVVGLGLLLWLL